MTKRISWPRHLDPTLVMAILLPLLAAGVFVGLKPSTSNQAPRAATTTDLTSAAVVCPPAIGDGDTVGATTTSVGVTGNLTATSVGSSRTRNVVVASGKPGWARVGSKPVVISGTDGLAPGLVAGRSSTDPVTAVDCPVAATNLWFTGAGSGPTHDSVVFLVNPNDGPAVVDIAVLGAHGPVAADALAGIAVAGHSTQRIDLGAVIPQSGPLALHAVVQRGQLAVEVEDEERPLIDNKVVGEWLPASASPEHKVTVLGLPPDGDRTLLVANTTRRQISATVKLVTATSVVTPSGAPTIDLPPNGVASVPIDGLLAKPAAKGAIGVEVDAGGPVVASIRTEVSSDLAISTAGSAIADDTAVLVPAGEKQLLLAGSKITGAVTVISIDKHGKKLATKRVALAPNAGAELDLPSGAVLVELLPEHATLMASVMILSTHGDAVVPLRPLVRNGLIPAVRPSLP